MNDKESRPGNLGRSAMRASILLALLLLDFPPGVPGALAQEPLGEPSELDEDDDLPTGDRSKSKRASEDGDMAGEAAQMAAPQPVVLPPAPEELEPATVGAPAVSDTNEEDDEESRRQPCGGRGDEPDMSAAPDPSPLSEDDDEAGPPAFDDAASSSPVAMPDEFD